MIPDHVYDMSWLFELVRTDGIHWFVNGQKVEAVKSGRSAAVFEIGRLFENVRVTPEASSARYPNAKNIIKL